MRERPAPSAIEPDSMSITVGRETASGAGELGGAAGGATSGVSTAGDCAEAGVEMGGARGGAAGGGRDARQPVSKGKSSSGTRRAGRVMPRSFVDDHGRPLAHLFTCVDGVPAL